jgi:hypothetical protein
MQKLHELLGKAPLQGDVGLEIECEGVGFKKVDNDFWRCEDDGSLRGVYPSTRIEYVLRKPIPVDQVKAAVINLKAALPNAVPEFSFRTSVHVHVNVLELTEAQLLTFIYTYLLLEEPLMSLCGKERKGNRFCLRYQDADGMSGVLSQVFSKGVNSLGNYGEGDIRYAAMNLAAIIK